ncbi:hypothetical protein WJX74_009221 [Apatococcus lobatus]|uniref:Peroxin/Ferlin domain-containing protein n=1 Tax=Apatococcus lobatus TaxID=904363 RepID=A0AAW1R0Q9_9CHLO
MFEAQLAFYLNKYLGAYVYGVDAHSLKVSVFQGDVVLENLQLKPEALADLNLPVVVRSGLVGSLKLKVPWASLGKSPVLVEMDRVYILAGSKEASVESTGESTETDFEAAARDAKRRRIHDAEMAWVQGDAAASEKQATEGGQGGGRFRAIIDTVIGNLQLSITNVHIRFEDNVSVPGMPLAAGLTIESLSSHTVDEKGNKAFVTHNPLELLRKAAELQRYSIYFDTGKELWKKDIDWKKLKLWQWDKLFQPGISAVPPRGMSDPERTYILRPVGAELTYIRRGSNIKRKENEPVQDLVLKISSVSLHVSRPQYQSIQSLLGEFSAYAARVPNKHLRPASRPLSAKACKQWWHYAATVILQRTQRNKVYWKQLSVVCSLRKQYVPMYIACLQNGQMGGDKEIEDMDAQLPEASIKVFRRLAHAKVEQEKRRAAAAAAAEKQAKAASTWWGWATGAGKAKSPEDAANQQDDMRADLTADEYSKLEDMVSEQEQAVKTGAETPTTLRMQLQVQIGSMAAALDHDDGSQIVHSGMQNLQSTVKLYPETKEIFFSVEGVGVVAPNGSLLETGAPHRRGAPKVESKAALNAFFVQKPQDGRADAALDLSLGSSYVTYNLQTINQIADFFKTQQAMDLSALGAQAVAQIDRARQAAKDQLQAALDQKPKLLLHVSLDAPKVAIPVAASSTGEGQLTLVADLGHFTLESDVALVSSLTAEKASLYECLKLDGKDLSAYLVDGEFSFAALQQLGRPADQAEGLDTAIQPAGKIGHGGTSVFVPLLDRCGLQAALQAARFPHPSFPQIQMQLQVASLNFFFSPARIARVLRVMKAALPAPEEQAKGEAAGSETWRRQAEHTGAVRVLQWAGVGGTSATWPKRHAFVHKGTLYLLENAKSASPSTTTSFWTDRHVVKAPAEACGGLDHVLAILPDGADVAGVAENPDAVLLRLRDHAEADDWIQHLKGSQRIMREMVGSINDSGSSEDTGDWDTNSAAGAEVGDAISQEQGQTKPEGVKFVISAELGELALHVSGRPPEVWQVPQAGTNPLGESRASTASSPGVINIDANLALGSFEIQDSLASAVAPSLKYLAKSAASISDGSGEEFFDADASLSRTSVSSAISTSSEQFEDASDGIESIPTGNQAAHLPGAAKHHAWVLEFESWKPDSPEYSGLDAQLQTRLTSLLFFCNRPTVAALMCFGTDLGEALKAGQLAKAPAPSQPRQLESQESVSDFSSLEEPGNLVKSGGEERTVMRVIAAIEKLEVTLQYEGVDTPPLALASMEDISVSLNVHPSTLALKGSLGNLRATDTTLPEGHPYQHICTIRKGAESSLIELEFASHQAHEAQAGGRVPAGMQYSTLTAQLQELQVVFLNRFVKEVTNYIILLLALQKASLRQPPAESPHAPSGSSPRHADASQQQKQPQQQQTSKPKGPPFVLQMDVKLAAPVITMPRSTDSSDSMQIDLGSLHLTNTVRFVRGSQDNLSEAVIVEHDSLIFKDISAVVSADGKRGNNIIREYEQGMQLDLRRPVHDPPQNLPGIELSISMPSIKATLSDREYQLATSMASSNMSEELRTPDSAIWIDQYLQSSNKHPQADDNQAAGAAEAEAMGPASSSGLASIPDTETGDEVTDVEQQAPVSSGPARGQVSVTEKTNTRVLIKIGTVDLELLRTTNEPTGAVAPLAHFSIKTVWLALRMTSSGSMYLSLSVPQVQAADQRPWVPEEHSLVISSAHTSMDLHDGPAKGKASPTLKPSFMMLEFEQHPAKALQNIRITLQRPTVVAEIGFLLAVTKFFVPTMAISGVSPIPFVSQDIYLEGKQLLRVLHCTFVNQQYHHSFVGKEHKAESDVWLSPECRLLADAPGVEDFVYNGQGHRLLLPEGIQMADPIPLIVVGYGKTLILTNVKIIHAASMHACVDLASGSQVVAHPEDNVEKFEGMDPTMARPQSATAGLTSGKLASQSRTWSTGFSRGSMSTENERRPAQAPKQTLATLQLSIAAVGMGLRFVELEQTDLEKHVLRGTLDHQKAAQQGVKGGTTRMLAAYLDAGAKIEMQGDRQKIDADLRGLRIETQTNVTHSSKSQKTERVHGHVLEPCKISVHVDMAKGAGDVRLQISDVHIRVSPDVIELGASLQASVLEPLVQPSADRPLSKCNKFGKLWSNNLDGLGAAEAATEVSILGSASGATFWRPKPAIGYVALGDCITSGSMQPAFQVISVAVNSGIIAYPVRFKAIWSSAKLSVWQPEAPAGYVAIGCLVTTDHEPPAVTEIGCLHQKVLVEAPVGQLLNLKPPPKPRQNGGAASDLVSFDSGHLDACKYGYVWCVENCAATFWASADGHAPAQGMALDLRSPLGVTPAALPATIKKSQEAQLARLYAKDTAALEARKTRKLYEGFISSRKTLLQNQSQRRLRSPCVDFERIWWDRDLRGFSKSGISIWRPAPPPGYVSLGDCLETGHDPPRHTFVVRGGDIAEEGPETIPLTKAAQKFQLLWRDDSAAPQNALSIYKAIAPPGFVTMGCIAVIGSEPPKTGTVHCLRNDATVLGDRHGLREAWRYRPSRGTKFSAWICDETLSTFLLGRDIERPAAEDICHVKVLEQEERSAQALSRPQQSSQAGLNVVVNSGDTTLLLSDALRRSLMQIELGKINAGMSSLPTSVLQAHLDVQVSIWSFNSVIESWEPVMEPWGLLTKLELNRTLQVKSGVQPGMHLSVKSTSETVYMTLAYAAINACAGAYLEWRDLHASGEQENYKRQLAAADSSSIHSRVDNQLGVDVELALDFDSRVDTVEVKAGQHRQILQPLPRPPIRQKQHHTIAKDSQPAALLIADIGSTEALSKAGISSLEDAELFCAISLTNAASTSHTGGTQVRTRAVTPNSGGNAEWNEQLVLDLAAPSGEDMHELRLIAVLHDLAAEAGRGLQVGTAEVQLDISDWSEGHPHSQMLTFLGANSAEVTQLEISFALVLQHQRDTNEPTDAWNAEISTAGQRAMRIDGQEQWTTLASSSLQRSINQQQHRRKASRDHGPAAVVLPVRMPGGKGIALESSFQHGLKQERLRTLCQVVNSTSLTLEVSVVQTHPSQQPSPAAPSQNSRQSPRPRNSGGVRDMAEDTVFEHERVIFLKGWSPKYLLPTERKRFSRSADGASSDMEFPDIQCASGWEWQGGWTLDTKGNVDSDGWQYGSNFGLMRYPPGKGAENRGPLDVVRRRRWVRIRHQAKEEPPAEGGPSLSDPPTPISDVSEGALQASQSSTERQVLGRISPGDLLALPMGWNAPGKQVQVRPLLSGTGVATHAWSVGASEGPDTVLLDNMEEGITRLLTCSLCKRTQSEGKNIMEGDAQPSQAMEGLLMAPIWLSLSVEGDELIEGSHTPLTDWRIVIAAPLTVENQLPVKGTAMVWERSLGADNLAMRHSQHIETGKQIQVYSADMRRNVSLQFYPDGYELVEAEPTIISEGYSSHKAGVDGTKLPDKFLIQKTNGSEPPLGILLERDIDVESSLLDKRKLEPAAAVALGSSMKVRMYVPLWISNATDQLISAAVVPVSPPAQSQADQQQRQSRQPQSSMRDAAESMQLRILQTSASPAGSRRELSDAARLVNAGSVAMMVYPVRSMAAVQASHQQGQQQQQQAAQDARLYHGLKLKVGESGWSAAIPLESTSTISQAQDFNTKPVLLRAPVQEWGVMYEVVARLELVGGGFERTMVLRLESHVILSNRTGVPLQVMQYSSAATMQPLSQAAIGVEPASGPGLPRGQPGQNYPPGLKGAIVDQSVDWTTCMELPADAGARPLQWGMTADHRAVCLRLTPNNKEEGTAPWSCPIAVDFPAGKDRHVAIPIRPPTSAAASTSGTDGRASGHFRPVSTVLSAAGPAWQLEGSDVTQRLKHIARTDQGQAGSGPESMDEVGLVVLRFSIELRSPGCYHIVLESMSPRAPYHLENRTSHPLLYRQAGKADLPYQTLPPLSAAGFIFQPTGLDESRHEVELKESYGGQQSGLYSLEPADAASSSKDASMMLQRQATSSKLANLKISAPPGECIVALLDRQQAMLINDGLITIGSSASIGRGDQERMLRILPGKKGPYGGVTALLDAPATGAETAGQALYITASFTRLEISVVDQKPEEVLAATFMGLKLESASGIGQDGSFSSLRFQLSSIQLDDQLPNSRCPVLLCPAGQEEEVGAPPLVQLTAISQPGLPHNEVYYPYLSFRIERALQVSVNEALVWRLVEVWNRLDLASLSRTGDDQQVQASTDTPVQISLVYCSDLTAAVSFKGDVSSRPSWAGGALSWALNLASFEGVPIQLTGFEMEHVQMLRSLFLKHVIGLIQGQLVGIAFGFIRSFGVFSGASGVLGAISAGLAGVAFDKDFASEQSQQRQERSIAGVGEGLKEGGGAFGRSLLSGFTGLVNKPLAGARRDGVQGFVQGVGRGIIGAAAQPVSGAFEFMSSTFEGIDAVKDQLVGRIKPSDLYKRNRLPRAIGGDGRLQPFSRSDGSERQARLEELGQALLRRAQDASGVGLMAVKRRLRTRYSADAYEEHMLLPDNDQVVMLTNRAFMLLSAPGFAAIHNAAARGAAHPSTNQLPAAELKWAVTWTDLLNIEARAVGQTQYANYLTIHRKGVPGVDDGEPLAYELRCFPNHDQARELQAIATKVHSKFFISVLKKSSQWAQRMAALPRQLQELPCSILCTGFDLLWHTDSRASSVVTIWRPKCPAGYKPLGDVAERGFDHPDPVQVYRDDALQKRRTQNAATAYPTAWVLIWRSNGSKPVTMWKPVAPAGYRALGTVIVSRPDQPKLEQALCVRGDLVVPSDSFEAPIWVHRPPELNQGAMALQQLAPYDPTSWKVSIWQVANAPHTFIAMRSFDKPPQQAANDVKPW